MIDHDSIDAIDNNVSPTYRVRRRSFDGSLDEVMASGLTRWEAQTWCRDPETSSRTCTRPEKIALTEAHGPWFDGFEEE